MFAAILATVAYDIGAYAIGRAMGRTPLSTHSPNKTLEGLVGGAVVCLVVTAAVIGGFSVAPWGDAPGGFADTLILGIVAAVAATLGDLCESMIKRDLGVKDMGTMLPGHGGILDRFDGLLFVMPATWCAALALGIVEATSVVSG
jgi:phosphatidate cytidylyltransferase